MAQLSSPITFSAGQVLTAADLMAHVNSATLLAGSINDQTAITAFDIQSTDTFNIYDFSGAVLRKATIDDLFRSGQIATFDNISGKAGQNLSITPASGYAVAINGNLNAGAALSVTGTSTLNGAVILGNNLSVTGTSTFTGNATFNTTEAVKIPVGTTAQRPSPASIGQLRYNSTLASSEVYNGSAWVSFTSDVRIYTKYNMVTAGAANVETMVYTSPALTIPADETWMYEIKIWITSGYVGGNTRPDTNTIQCNIYNNTTPVDTINASTSPYGEQNTTFFFSKELTSVNNGFIFVVKVLSNVAMSDQYRYMVKLTKVKTTSLADKTSCI